MKDFYYILGTTINATPPEIDAAYKKLARKFHQAADEQDEFMDAHFREISEAYDTLRDDYRRQKYDLAFRKNQKKQLAVFKLKYLNIAVAVTFLIVTALFADYVIKTIRGHAPKKVAQTALIPPPVASVHSKKRHKVAIVNAKKPLTHPDTTLKATVKARPVIAKPASVDSTYMITLHSNITGIVYLHQAPDYNSAVLAKIPDAAVVRVLKKGTAYYKVKFNGQSGYVIKSAVTGNQAKKAPAN
jgi:DnaJ domain/Bacterial SH3 domain